MVLDFIFYQVLVAKAIKDYLIKFCKKTRFSKILGLRCLQYFLLISVKTKAFWKNSFINKFRIKSSTNAAITFVRVTETLWKYPSLK